MFHEQITFFVEFLNFFEDESNTKPHDLNAFWYQVLQHGSNNTENILNNGIGNIGGNRASSTFSKNFPYRLIFFWTVKNFQTKKKKKPASVLSKEWLARRVFAARTELFKCTNRKILWPVIFRQIKRLRYHYKNKLIHYLNPTSASCVLLPTGCKIDHITVPKLHRKYVMHCEISTATTVSPSELNEN